MIDLNDLEPIEEAHEFEVDLTCLVIANHKLTLEGIEREENEELEKLPDISPDDLSRSIENQIQNFYDGLRRAANNFAAVALVTRMQHWIGRFVRKIRANGMEPGLVNGLNILNSEFCDGPVAVEFFEKLVTVRDSVIHNDSKIEWIHRGGLRRVTAPYANSWGETEISDSNLAKATASAIAQVKWYDEKLRARQTGKTRGQ